MLLAMRTAATAATKAGVGARTPWTSLKSMFVVQAGNTKQSGVFMMQWRCFSGSANSRKPGRAKKAVPTAAIPMMTASIKRVGEKGARLIGFEHLPGKLGSVLAKEAANALGLHASTTVLYEVTDEQLKAKLDDMDVMCEEDAQKLGARKLPSLQAITSNTVLLAVGTPLVGTRPAPTASARRTTAQMLMAALPYAKEVKIPGQPDGGCTLLMLQDAEGTPVAWPGLDSHKLLIPSVYRDFYEREDMLNSMAARPTGMPAHSLVRGVPGIGKSCFALYCLWRLCQAGRHVLYSHAVGLGASVVECGSGPRKDAVLIADGTDAFAVDSGTKLLVTSPRQPYIAAFEKQSKSFYLPAPTRHELLLMRDTCLDGPSDGGLDALDDSVVDDRVRRWGCVPRFVLAETSYERDQFAMTVGMLDVRSLRKLLQKRTESLEPNDVTLRLLHYDFPHEQADRLGIAMPAPYSWPLQAGVLPRDYTSVGMRWATPYMEGRVADFFMGSG